MGTARSLPPSMMNLARKWLRKMLRLLKWMQQLMMFPQSSTLRASQRFTGCPREHKPVSYNGGRELDDFVKYIAENASDELKGYKRKGKEVRVVVTGVSLD